MGQYSLSGNILLELNMVVEADGKSEALEHASFYLANAEETLTVNAYHDGEVTITEWNYGDFELPQPEQVIET